MENKVSLKAKEHRPNNSRRRHHHHHHHEMQIDSNKQTLASISRLPNSIIIDILSRLPIRSLSSCRRVCPLWRTLTREPLFTNMHLSRASSPSLLLQTNSPKHGLPYDLYLAEPETCHPDDAVTRINTKFNRSNREFEIVGSINGLLCLSEPLYYDPVYICNPIIGEYMTLPKSDIVSGFGFHQETNQYKVIRMLYVTIKDPVSGKISFKLEGEIHTIGSNEWRRIGEIPYPLRARGSEAYLNGALHWLMTDLDIGIDTSEFIGSFDVATEEFQSIPPPHQLSLEPRTSVRRFKLNLSVLDEKLCIFNNYFDDRVEIWVMRDYGVRGSWAKQFVIERPRSGVYFKPLKLLKSGDILILYDSVAIVRYNPKRNLMFHLGLFGLPVATEIYEGIVHVGSLVSLSNTANTEGQTRIAAISDGIKGKVEGSVSRVHDSAAMGGGSQGKNSCKSEGKAAVMGLRPGFLLPKASRGSSSANHNGGSSVLEQTSKPKLDIFKWRAEHGGVLHVGELTHPSVP